MKKMFLFFILINGCLIHAQHPGDHLEPVPGLYNTSNMKFGYAKDVREVLLKDLSRCPEIRLITFPSFATEYVLQIEKDSDLKKHYLVCNLSEKSIWHKQFQTWEQKEPNDISDVTIKKFKCEIDESSVDLVYSLFKIAVDQTQYPKIEMSGLDGTTYYFSYCHFGLKSGVTWSPGNETKLKRLVEVGDLMINLVVLNQDCVNFSVEECEKIENLIEDFKISKQ